MAEKKNDLPPEEVFKQLRAHCLEKEGAVEEYPWEHVGWKVGGKLFAIGGEDSNVVTLKSTPEKQEGLVQHPSICVAAYVGRYGWVTVTVDDEATLEITLDLVDESYDLVRKKGRKKKTSGEAKA